MTCGRRLLALAIAIAVASSASTAYAQASRLTILQAEERGAPTAADLATIRAGARSSDGDTVRVAWRKEDCRAFAASPTQEMMHAGLRLGEVP